MYWLSLDSKVSSRFLHSKQSMGIPPAFQQTHGWRVDVVPLPLRFEDLLLGVKPVL